MPDSVIQTSPKKRGNPNLGPGPGRPKGSQNRVQVELKDMIRVALEEAGGAQYLKQRALDSKTAPAFLALLGKILPLQLTGSNGRTLAQELAGIGSETAIAAAVGQDADAD